MSGEQAGTGGALVRIDVALVRMPEPVAGIAERAAQTIVQAAQVAGRSHGRTRNVCGGGGDAVRISMRPAQIAGASARQAGTAAGVAERAGEHCGSSALSRRNRCADRRQAGGKRRRRGRAGRRCAVRRRTDTSERRSTARRD